ncbi:hypothetical protein L8106_20283 [Lyngbya sp. PCC 8106]|nr:hypothetical protein L8106_20283 [Lyngbya sp. PCC 8106]
MEMVQKVRSRLIKWPPIPGFRGNVAIEMIREKQNS